MESIYTSDRAVWRAWLEENFRIKQEIWFVFPMKASHEPSLSYNDAVEEALCFGWIDSTIKHIDSLHRAQHFTPRKQGSPYSRPNIERLLRMEKLGRIHPSIRDGIIRMIEEPYVFPEDILAVVRNDPQIWSNYELFPAPYRRIRVAYIDAARKRPDEFQKRLQSFLEKTKANRRITGLGGIDQYYEEESKANESRR